MGQKPPQNSLAEDVFTCQEIWIYQKYCCGSQVVNLSVHHGGAVMLPLHKKIMGLRPIEVEFECSSCIWVGFLQVLWWMTSGIGSTPVTLIRIKLRLTEDEWIYLQLSFTLFITLFQRLVRIYMIHVRWRHAILCLYKSTCICLQQLQGMKGCLTLPYLKEACFYE